MKLATPMFEGALSVDVVTSTLSYDLGLGLGLLLVDTAMTFFVVGRVVARQEERKRRALSGLVEARALESIAGLLADGLPISCRTATSETRAVGRIDVAIAVSAIDLEGLAVAGAREPDKVLPSIKLACARYGSTFSQPFIASIIEPKIAPTLVQVINALDAANPVLAEWEARPTAEIASDALGTSTALFEATWELRAAILSRWT